MKNGISGKSVLVIDDNPGMLRALKRVLSGEGVVVTCADWAGDAIKTLAERSQKFDLVITDLRMPFVTGITVVYAVHEIFPALPVIVLTAFASPETRAVCLKEGAVAFLEKPLNSEELIAAVRDALQESNGAGSASRQDNVKSRKDNG
jgi:DNA-binding NtrC family response regulator